MDERRSGAALWPAERGSGDGQDGASGRRLGPPLFSARGSCCSRLLRAPEGMAFVARRQLLQHGGRSYRTGNASATSPGVSASRDCWCPGFCQQPQLITALTFAPTSQFGSSARLNF